MSGRQPAGPPPPPVVARLRIRYAKRGRLRFTSHRDFARAFERALRRAAVPMAFSAGFSPHPKISWVGAAPTGVASEAEYVEIGLTAPVDPDELRTALDAALPAGLDVLDVLPATGGGLAERIAVSHWQIILPGIARDQLAEAVDEFLAREQVLVSRLTKNGRRELDARAPVVFARADTSVDADAGPGPCAILNLVVQHVTPAVRPDDVLSALRSVADLQAPVPPRAVRLAQGSLDEHGEVADPLAAERRALIGAQHDD